MVFDPERREVISKHRPHTHHMRVDYSAYEGHEVEGWPEIVISRGRVVVDNGSLSIQGGGKYIARARTGDLLR